MFHLSPLPPHPPFSPLQSNPLAKQPPVPRRGLLCKGVALQGGCFARGLLCKGVALQGGCFARGLLCKGVALQGDKKAKARSFFTLFARGLLFPCPPSKKPLGEGVALQGGCFARGTANKAKVGGTGGEQGGQSFAFF